MTIQIPQPSMALNAEGIETWNSVLGKYERVFEPYRMWNTWTVGTSIVRDHVIDHVSNVADSAPDHYLRVLIINAHGWHAYISMGQGLRPLTPLYERWRGKVANIWFCSCGLIGMATRQNPKQPPDWNDGNLFCSGLAKLTGAYVVASMDEQPLQIIPRWGAINDWAGRVLRYEPEHGSVDWRHDYGMINLEPPPPIGVPPRFRAFQGGPGSFWRERRQKPWYSWHPSQLRHRSSP